MTGTYYLNKALYFNLSENNGKDVFFIIHRFLRRQERFDEEEKANSAR
jgi:hypothetical protein